MSALAISIRQPWAWLILHGGKDIENRTWRTSVRGPVLIHAASSMKPFEWDRAVSFVASFDRALAERVPRAHGLEFGGIVGSVQIIGVADPRVLDKSDPALNSPWFMGPIGFILCNQQPMKFRACRGSLGFFNPEFPKDP